MFVVRYLLAALASIAGALTWGTAAEYSAWQIAGLAFLAVLVLQVLILGYVMVAAARRPRDPLQAASQQGARESRDQLVILPR